MPVSSSVHSVIKQHVTGLSWVFKCLKSKLYCTLSSKFLNKLEQILKSKEPESQARGALCHPLPALWECFILAQGHLGPGTHCSSLYAFFLQPLAAA